MKNKTRWYRLLLRLYPAAFQDRFADEMTLTFEESYPRGGGCVSELGFALRTVSDVVRSAAGERIAEFRFQKIAGLIAAIALASPLGYLDSHTTEVQVTVFFILLLSGLFSLISPRRAWFWFLAFGISVPAWHISRFYMGYPAVIPVHPNVYASLVAMIPAAIGAAAGAGVRLAFEPTR